MSRIVEIALAGRSQLSSFNTYFKISLHFLVRLSRECMTFALPLESLADVQKPVLGFKVGMTICRLGTVG